MKYSSPVVYKKSDQSRIVRFGVLSALLVGISLFSSCAKETTDNILPSVYERDMKAEGDCVTVRMERGAWSIPAVYSANGIFHLFDSETNRPMKLDGLGAMSFWWFKVTRTDANTLEIVVDENFDRMQSRGFVVVLQDGAIADTLRVMQKPSAGYDVVSIDYSLEPTDRDSVYYGSWYMDFVLKNGSSSVSKIVTRPFVNTKNGCAFIPHGSSEEAFSWVGKEKLMVDVPETIVGDEVFIGGVRRNYASSSDLINSELVDVAIEMEAPARSKAMLFVRQRFCDRRVSYQMVVANRETKQEKVLRGTWCERKLIDFESRIELGGLE